jgi:thiosulfate/3-mercaptopyruvate sulfurtransferase
MHHTTLISSSSFKPSCSAASRSKFFDGFDLEQPLLGHQQYVEAHIPGAIYASWTPQAPTAAPVHQASGTLYPREVLVAGHRSA